MSKKNLKRKYKYVLHALDTKQGTRWITRRVLAKPPVKREKKTVKKHRMWKCLCRACPTQLHVKDVMCWKCTNEGCSTVLGGTFGAHPKLIPADTIRIDASKVLLTHDEPPVEPKSNTAPCDDAAHYPTVCLKLDAHTTWKLRYWFELGQQLLDERRRKGRKGWTKQETANVASFLDGEALEKLGRAFLAAFKEQHASLLSDPGEPRHRWTLPGKPRRSAITELLADRPARPCPVPVLRDPRSRSVAPLPRGEGLSVVPVDERKSELSA